MAIVRFLVADVDAVVAFYTSVLGFEQALIVDPSGNPIELFEPGKD